MSDITRSESIKQLHRLKADINHGLAFVSKTKDKHLALESLDMAIESLKTDEAYQLEYEQPEFCVDCISRQEVIDLLMQKWGENFSGDDAMQESIDAIREMPSVTPQEPKPMVEIDLYSVIKQKYIEREVLDKIRAEIESKYNNCDICEFVEDYDYEENDISEYRPIGDIADILEIIDKYKGENEG